MPIFSYSVLQYVPDAVRDERVNVGVLVASEDDSFFGARLVSRREHGRLRRLGYDRDFSFLLDLQAQLRGEARDAGQIPGTQARGWNAARLREISSEWAGTLQATSPRPVLHDRSAALVAELYARYVADPTPARSRSRDKRWVNKRIRTGLRAYVQARQPAFDLGPYLTPRVKVSGALEEHLFDYRLQNGKPLELMRSLSLENASVEKARTEIDAIAWSISDVNELPDPTPVTVVSIGNGKLAETASRLYDGLGATFIREGEIDDWLAQSAEKLFLSVAPDQTN
jgi:hypothetical protein